VVLAEVNVVALVVSALVSVIVLSEETTKETFN